MIGMLEPPGVSSLATIVITTAVVGVALDKLVLSTRLESWRKNVAGLWVKLNSPGARDLTDSANQLFTDLFDFIYGKRMLSRRRVWSSVLSSVIGLIAVTLLLGYENTVWPEFMGLSYILVLATLVPAFLNLIPDFFSLAETRLVLKWSQGRSLPSILLLIVLDLFLTSAIFIAGYVFFFMAFSLVVLSGADVVGWVDDVLPFLMDPKGGLVFFLTTFVTSLFWILFVFSYALIWFFHRVSPLAKFVYYYVGTSDRPASAALSIFNGTILAIYLSWVVLANVVGA